MSYGFVYILGNPCLPEIYKIGMTSRSPSLRCKELGDSTAAPAPFVLLAYYEFEDARSMEQDMHCLFSEFRVSPNREFFEVNLYSIAENLKTDECLSFYESRMVDLAGMGLPLFARRDAAASVAVEP